METVPYRIPRAEIFLFKYSNFDLSDKERKNRPEKIMDPDL